MRAGFYSSETRDRARKYMSDLLAEIGIAGKTYQRQSYDAIFLQVGEEAIYAARAVERVAKTGPYSKEPTGQVSIIVGRDKSRKTFTESLKAKRFSAKRFAQIVEWAKAYAETELDKKQKETEKWHAQEAVNDRLQEAFRCGRATSKLALPGAYDVRATDSNWNGNEIYARITITIPADAIEPVAEALRVALAPFAEEEEKDD